MLDDSTVVLALIADLADDEVPGQRTVAQWFNQSAVLDHLASATGRPRADLEAELTLWFTNHEGGYDTWTIEVPEAEVGAPLETTSVELWLHRDTWNELAAKT